MGVDSNRKALFNDLSEALAKQNFRLDSVSNKLEVLKDSVRNKITIFESEDPILDFCNDGVVLERQSKDTCEFLVKVCSQNAASRDVTLSLFILASSNIEKEIFKDLKYFTTDPNFLSKRLVIKKDGAKEQGISVFENDINKRKSFIFLIKGSYTNSTTTKKYFVNTIGIYYIDTKKFGFVSSPYDEQVRDFLKNKNILKE